MGQVSYRDATPADAALMARIGPETFTETFGHLYTPENLAAFLANHSEENWRAELEDGRYTVRIAEQGGAAAGFAKVGPPSLPDSLPFAVEGPAAELKQLYVLRPWQGAGVAQALMDWVLGEARRRGAAELYLSVFIDNLRARRFYARHGFEEVGRYAFMVGTHADEDIIMRLKL
jgi:ribosomal protein S18 acetylase RimI-like enzyme